MGNLWPLCPMQDYVWEWGLWQTGVVVVVVLAGEHVQQWQVDSQCVANPTMV